MSFDYCVVAVGVANGLWKPRSLEDLSGPTAASSSSTISTARPTKQQPAQPAVPVPSPGGSALDERRLDGRRRNLQLLHEKLANAPGAVVVGAGLVGVELAAELAHFFPRLKVTLVDGAAHVLPQLADPARDYTMEFFAKHGVKLRLGQPFVPELVSEGEVVLWCVGTKPRASELFVDRSVLRSNGQIRVNKRMQVLGSSHMGLTSVEELNHGVVLQPLGQGQIFAIGDAASVEGVPLAQMIFHGEEMASIAVANIEAAENVASPIALGGAKKEAEVGQPLLACTSLGPQDGSVRVRMFRSTWWSAHCSQGPQAAPSFELVRTASHGGACKPSLTSARKGGRTTGFTCKKKLWPRWVTVQFSSTARRLCQMLVQIGV